MSEHPSEVYLPMTDVTLEDAASQLTFLHLNKESLTDGERTVLYVAEGLLRLVEEMRMMEKPEKLEEPVAWRAVLDAATPGKRTLTDDPEVAQHWRERGDLVEPLYLGKP